MKRNIIILSSVILALLLLIWFQHHQYNKKDELQKEAYQKLVLENKKTDSLCHYYQTVQKAQYYFLKNEDSLAIEILKPYGKLPDSIQNLIQHTRRFKTLNSVVEKSYQPTIHELSQDKNDWVDVVLAENSIVKSELALVKQELDELKTPKAMLDLVSSKGVKFQYIGQFKRGNANGYGIGLFESGSVYKGFWKDNKRQGKGVFTWKDGERYEGNYVEDKRDGEGNYYWKNGEIFKGQWQDDKRNGPGKLFKKNGKLKKEGIWINDEFKSS
ncbi:hypothetical protein AAGV33_03385 [Flavobacterium sp. FBOR7N2.3]|uniref:MORN repeat protein n=1 Tax=Flavobacterium magnesitis TaxID=3138077 RepID=A0ABV4TH51_9FLAO